MKFLGPTYGVDISIGIHGPIKGTKPEGGGLAYVKGLTMRGRPSSEVKRSLIETANGTRAFLQRVN